MRVFRYYRVWESMLAESDPLVAQRLKALDIDPHLYLFNWLQTLYLKVLPLEARYFSTVVW